MNRADRWLILLGIVVSSDCLAGTIQPFSFSVPSLESPAECDVDSSLALADYDRVTVSIQATGGWWTRVRTLYNVPRDSTIVIRDLEAPVGFCLIRVRSSEGSLISCWSKPLGRVSINRPGQQGFR